MPSSYKRSGVIVAFGLLLALLMANAYFMRREVEAQVEAESLVTRSRQALAEAEKTESLLKDAETGQRGYLITGNAAYLEPYNRAITQIEPHINQLAHLTAEDPTQQDRIGYLRTLTRGKLDELARTVALYQSGKVEETREVVLTHLGQSYMDEIRRVLAQMEQDSRATEAARDAGYKNSQRDTVKSIYLTSFLAALCLALLCYYIVEQMRIREKHALQMRAREEWYRVTLTGIGDAVIATDERGVVTFLNPVAEALTGNSMGSARGKPIQEVFPIFHEVTHAVAEDPVKKVLAHGRVVGLANHTVLLSGDGTLVPIEDSAAPIRDDEGRLIGVVLVFRDASKERKAQEVLRKTEKLASAARLAASMAHELNNPLAAVTNLVYLANQMPGSPAEVGRLLTQVEAELKRVAHITQQTLGFYREAIVPGPIEFPELVESVLAIYSSKLKSKNITVEMNFSVCPPLLGVAGELKQVISNLVSNAADAVGHGGTIRMRLQTIDRGGKGMAQFVIEDDGPGVAADDIDRIFEPFFTTKTDVGTGLGLWVTKEILERHGGSIHLSSRGGAGSGAAFTVLLEVRNPALAKAD